MPNIRTYVGQIKMRAQSIYSSPPLLKWLTHGKLFIFDQQPRHLLEGSEFNFKILPNIGLKVAAESRTAESPIVNIFAKTIFARDIQLFCARGHTYFFSIPSFDAKAMVAQKQAVL